MRLVVHLLHPVRSDVGIDLGRAQRLVAQKLLHRPQVRTVVEQVSRERMPQRMRTDARIEPRFHQILVEFSTDAARTQPLPVLVHVKGIGVETRRPAVGGSHVQVTPDRLQCRWQLRQPRLHHNHHRRLR